MRRWLLRRLADDKQAESVFAARTVQFWEETHGMASVLVTCPAATARRLYDTLDGLAGQIRTDDDTRTAAQRRADAVEVLLDGTGEVATTVAVVLPVTGEGATVGGVPVPFHHGLVEAMAANPAWQVWLADPTGLIVDTVSVGRRIPARLDRTVRARDQHCRFPGCTVPAARCDLDHTIAWPDGPSAYDNLACLCRRHHRVKHHGGWTYQHTSAGTLHWTSPTGRTYTTTAPNQLPITA